MPILTYEQEEAIHNFSHHKTTSINAFAGTGKTTTLLEIARSHNHLDGLYLAFNKSIANEVAGIAGKTSNLSSRTTHSLAAGWVRSTYKFDDSKLFSNLNPNWLAKQLGLKDLSINEEITLRPSQLAFLIVSTVSTFCNSSNEKITSNLVPVLGALKLLQKNTLEGMQKYIAELSEYVWGHMRDQDSTYPLGHDGYLKIWSLDSPSLPFDYILLDEAQDTNDAVLHVLSKQKCKLVYVGDKYQQIYEWRGATNAMQKISFDKESTLSHSFRFGSEIANLANQVLLRMNEDKTLKGNSNINTTLRDDVAFDAYISRTNAGLLHSLVEVLGKNHKPFVVGGTNQLRNLLLDVCYLKRGNPAKTIDLFGFEDWDQVISFIDEVEGAHLRPFVKICQTIGENKLLELLENTRGDINKSDCTLTTAHKAKGREWNSVRINQDFTKKWMSETSPLKPEEYSEANLFYVAITRCKTNLSIPSGLTSPEDFSRCSANNSKKSPPPRPSFIREIT